MTFVCWLISYEALVVVPVQVTVCVKRDYQFVFDRTEADLSALCEFSGRRCRVKPNASEQFPLPQTQFVGGRFIGERHAGSVLLFARKHQLRPLGLVHHGALEQPGCRWWRELQPSSIEFQHSLQGVESLHNAVLR